jgi:hypothetical protein
MGNYKRKMGKMLLLLVTLAVLFTGGLWASVPQGLVCRANLFFHYMEASEDAGVASGKNLSLRERIVYSLILSNSVPRSGPTPSTVRTSS